MNVVSCRILIICLTVAATAIADDRYWPQWRGPLATGEAPHTDPPVRWSEEQNIKWKIELPGRGHSTPIAWGERVFVTAAVPVGDALSPKYSGRPGAHDNLPVTHEIAFVVLAVNRADGAIVWQKTLLQSIPHEGGHETATFASASPVTDGEHLFAFFGSHGLYALNLGGDLLWQKDLGDMHTKHGHGEGASPALHGDTLIVNWDHQEQSFIVAFDKRTGGRRWKQNRDESTSWATPIIVEHKGKPQVIVSGTNRIRGYDLADGKMLWQRKGLSNNVVASPVAHDGTVFAGSSYEKQILVAFHLDNPSKTIWSRKRRTPYVPSPLLTGGHLYFISHYQNVISRVEIDSGDDAPGAFRLPGVNNLYASPVAAANRIYLTDLDGATLVLTADDPPRALALNQLDDSFSASAALVGKQIILRGARHLYCIAEN